MFKRVRPFWLLAAVAFAAPLLFAAFTQHAWEDYFITLRSSRNLVEGNGLVFNPGERVHTFTSPLGVLLPALCTWLAGVHNETVALWLFRLINAATLAAAAVLVWQRLKSLQVGAWGMFLFFGLTLADSKLTDFSINGMETAVLVFFALLLWCELESPAGPRVRRLALACAGLMWTRPDAFVLAGALVGSRLLFRSSTPQPRLPLLKTMLRGAALGAVLYVPWLIWAGLYYGTPIPHTIIAKSGYTVPFHVADVLLLSWRTLTGDSLMSDLWLPTYWAFGSWPTSLTYLARALTVLTVFGWLWPTLPATVRRLSFSLFIGMFYLCFIILFPWYTPPWSVVGYLALALGLDHFYRKALERRRLAAASGMRIAAALLIACQVVVFVAVAWQMRVHQRIVENGVRRPIGEWLRQHAAKGDTVFLEPLGYIGYFSQLKTYDFPGLSSPEVVSVVRHGARSYAAIIERLHPTWVVLRPGEAARPEFKVRPVLNDYQLVQAWDAREALNAVPYLPGRAWVELEASYLVFRRKS